MARTPKTPASSKAKKAPRPSRQKPAPKKAADTNKQEEPVKEASGKTEIERGAPAEKPADESPAQNAAAEDVPPSSPAPSPSMARASSAATPSAKKSGPWLGAFVILILLSAAAAGAFVTRDVWWINVDDYLPGFEPQEDPRVAILMERLGVLESVVEAGNADKDLAGASFQELQQARERLSRELSAVMQRLEAVEKSMETVERMAMAVGSEADSGDAQESLKVLVDRVKTLEQSRQEVLEQTAGIGEVLNRLNALEEQNRNVGDTLSSKTALLEDVKRRMENLESRQGRATDSISPDVSALILAVGQLREVVRLGRPYSSELEALKAVLPGEVAERDNVSKNIVILQSHAGTGVASRAMLRDAFPSVSLAVVQADRKIQKDGWFSEAINRLGNLITIRRVDDISAGTVDARLAGAEAHLAAGDFGAVVEALSGLSGPGADAISPWLDQVRASNAVGKALRELNTVAIAELSAAQE